MNSFDLYCATCGAANIHTAVICFACGRGLGQAPEEDEEIASSSQQTLLNKRYLVLAQIGQGGFAKVYKAEDISDAKIVVIKAISLKSLTPQEIIDATDTYNREIHFGTTLKHASLPQIYDYFMDQNHWYIVAEFIEGQTLEEYMLHQPDKRLPLQEVLSIGAQVCSVLSYLHAHQPPIIFRDVKPDNIMRTTNGHMYLIDFGIARRSRPGQRRDTQTLGSPGYAAPEQYGSAQTTERSDIYSLGTTLRALLTGKNPLDMPVVSTEDDLTPGIQVPSEFTVLLARMLEKDPAHRYQNTEAVKQQLAYIMKYSNVVLQDAKKPITQANLFQPVASFTSTPGVGSIPVPAARRHVWQKVSIVSLTLLFIWVGAGSGIFSSISSLVQQGLLSHSLISSSGHVAKAPADKQVLTFALSSPGIETLDPVAAIDTSSMQAVGMLYSGLVTLDDTMNVRPQLAASWQQSTDGLTWTFSLRPNLHFSDGRALTSADVAYSLDRALDPAVNSPTAPSYLQYIADADKRIDGKIPTLIGDSILTPDSSTIIIKTSSKIGFFPYVLTCPCAFVVEKALIDKYGSYFIDHLSEGGSSGPFKFERQNGAGGMDFVVNYSYYGWPMLQVTKVSFLVYSDDTSAYQAYLAGKVTAVDVPQEDINTASVRSDFHKALQLQIDYYAMNYLAKPFDNVKIRQAFALALNKDLIAHTVWHDTVLATNHIIPLGQPGNNPALTGPAGVSFPIGDGGLALQLLQQGLKEEGMSELPAVTLTYATTSSTVENEVATIQRMWQSVLGIKINLQKLSFADLLSKEADSVNNPQGLQLWRLAYIADYPDPQDWTTLQFGQGSSLNTVNYGQNSSSGAAEQQAVQIQLQVADSMSDQNERVQAYQQAEQHLVDDVAWLPMYQVEKSYLLKTNVRGYKMNALDIIPADDWANIYIVQ